MSVVSELPRSWNKCMAPWHSLMIQWNGDIFADAVHWTPYDNLHDMTKEGRTLKDVWYNDVATKLRSTWDKRFYNPDQCRVCLKKARGGGTNRKNYFENNIPKELQEKATYNVEAEPDIWYLEINSSNKCNLKCRMCNGHISSSWIKEEQKLVEQWPEFMGEKKVGKYYKLEFKHFESILDNKKYFENLYFLKFTGGEPLMENQNYQILDKFIEWGVSKNMVLDINTNGTAIDGRLIDIAKNFKRLKLHISIEGTGELYQYIRGGDSFTLEQLEGNIKFFNQLENTDLIYTVTVQTYNILNLGDVWNWYQKIKTPGNEIYFRNIVVNPEYLDFNILPEDIKQIAVQKLIDNNVPFSNANLKQGNPGFDKIKESLETKPVNTEAMKQFKWYTKAVDKLRNTDIKTIVPEFEGLFNE
tara:strand:- start:1890 stop:3134 length:1245 start_codon:yes stop_codon:yes gene_type:complete